MFEDLQKEFGRLVRNARKNRGLTQEMTAELLEISCSHLRKIEHGKGGFNWGVWMKLTELFNIDLEKLQEKYLPQISDTSEFRIVSR